MKTKIDFDLKKSSFKFDYQQNLSFIGSCFSQEISKRLTKLKFHTYTNPFGVLFHPLTIAKNISESLENNDERLFNERLFNSDDLFFSWDANSTIYGKSEIELKEKLHQNRLKFKNQLQQKSLLIVTFGSAFGYIKKDDNTLVANCHKLPSKNFEKILSSVSEMETAWIKIIENLKKLNPELKIIFTVSPVRHTKDGIIENSRSKSRLLLLVEKLENKFSNVDYFPSYEIMIDELRDYRYFKRDLIHPNKVAVNYIFDKFTEEYLDENSKKITIEIQKLNQLKKHKIQFKESNAATQHQIKLQEIFTNLKKKYPELNWK